MSSERYVGYGGALNMPVILGGAAEARRLTDEYFARIGAAQRGVTGDLRAESRVVGGGTESWFERPGAPGVGAPVPAGEAANELCATYPGASDCRHAADRAAGLVSLAGKAEAKREIVAFPAGALGAEWSLAALVEPEL